jgi:hypothetical protein
VPATQPDQNSAVVAASHVASPPIADQPNTNHLLSPAEVAGLGDADAVDGSSHPRFQRLARTVQVLTGAIPPAGRLIS